MAVDCRFYRAKLGIRRRRVSVCLCVSHSGIVKFDAQVGYIKSYKTNKQEGLAVASIARDDPSTLPGDDPFPRAH